MSGSAISLPYFSYAHRHCATETPVPFHQHGGCEMLLIVRGRCRVESSLGTLEGRPGILIIIPPGLRHNQLNEPGERNLFCVFQANPELFPQTWRSMDVSGLGWVRRTFLELKRMTDRGDFTGAPALLCSRGSMLRRNRPGNFIRDSASRSAIFRSISRSRSPLPTPHGKRESVPVFCGVCFRISAKFRPGITCRICDSNGHGSCSAILISTSRKPPHKADLKTAITSSVSIKNGTASRHTETA